MKKSVLQTFAALALGVGLAQTGAVAQEGAGLLPPLPNFEIDGTIRHQDRTVTYDNLSGRIGEIPIEGNLRADLSQATPMVEGRVRLPQLDFDALQHVIDQLPEPPEPADEQGAIPPIRLPTEPLGRLGLELDIEAPSITNFPVALSSFSGHASIDDRRLSIKPFEIDFSKGTIKGETALNGRQAEPSADIHIDLDEIDIHPFFTDTRFADEIAGTLNGRLDLLGTGETLDQVLATANGEAWISIDNGTFSALIIEGVGIDVVEALSLYLGDDIAVPINCGRLDLVVENGLVQITRMIIDTQDSVLVGGGTIDLDKEELDLGIESRAKDFSLIDASLPILIDGTFREPSFSLGEADLFPFFELGNAEPVDCTNLLQSDFQRTVETDPEEDPEEDEEGVWPSLR